MVIILDTWEQKQILGNSDNYNQENLSLPKLSSSDIYNWKVKRYVRWLNDMHSFLQHLFS